MSIRLQFVLERRAELTDGHVKLCDEISVVLCELSILHDEHRLVLLEARAGGIRDVFRQNAKRAGGGWIALKRLEELQRDANGMVPVTIQSAPA